MVAVVVVVTARSREEVSSKIKQRVVILLLGTTKGVFNGHVHNSRAQTTVSSLAFLLVEVGIVVVVVVIVIVVVVIVV